MDMDGTFNEVICDYLKWTDMSMPSDIEIPDMYNGARLFLRVNAFS